MKTDGDYGFQNPFSVRKWCYNVAYSDTHFHTLLLVESTIGVGDTNSAWNFTNSLIEPLSLKVKCSSNAHNSGLCNGGFPTVKRQLMLCFSSSGVCAIYILQTSNSVSLWFFCQYFLALAN